MSVQRRPQGCVPTERPPAAQVPAARWEELEGTGAQWALGCPRSRAPAAAPQTHWSEGSGSLLGWHAFFPVNPGGLAAPQRGAIMSIEHPSCRGQAERQGGVCVAVIAGFLSPLGST